MNYIPLLVCIHIAPFFFIVTRDSLPFFYGKDISQPVWHFFYSSSGAVASLYLLYNFYIYILVDTTLNYYLPLKHLLIGHAILMFIPFGCGITSGALFPPAGKYVFWGVMACAFSYVVYFYATLGGTAVFNAHTVYEAKETVPIAFAQARWQIHETGYRLAVFLPQSEGPKAASGQGLTAGVGSTGCKACEVLFQAGVLDQIVRPALTSGRGRTFYQLKHAYLPDYNPVLGLRYATLALDSLKSWQYADPIGGRSVVLNLQNRAGSSSRRIIQYERTANEPRLYKSVWRVDTLSPWAENTAVQRQFSEIGPALAYAAGENQQCVLRQEGSRVFVEQLEPEQRRTYLKKLPFVDTAEYNDPNLHRKSNVFLERADGTYAPVQTSRQVATEAREQAFLMQHGLAEKHSEHITDALNAYLAQYSGILHAHSGEKIPPQFARTENMPDRQHPVQPMVWLPGRMQRVPLVDDPGLPQPCAPDSANCVRFAYFQVDRVTHISSVFESLGASHFGYCLVRFTCKPVWEASWARTEALQKAYPFVAALFQTLETHELTWIVRINGLGWDTGKRSYGTNYTIVHDEQSGSGM